MLFGTLFWNVFNSSSSKYNMLLVTLIYYTFYRKSGWTIYKEKRMYKKPKQKWQFSPPINSKYHECFFSNIEDKNSNQ